MLGSRYQSSKHIGGPKFASMLLPLWLILGASLGYAEESEIVGYKPHFDEQPLPRPNSSELPARLGEPALIKPVTSADEVSLPEEGLIIPKTSFTCSRKIDGFYADTETGCRVFHYCQTFIFPDGEKKNKDWTFFCPQTTIFQQERLTCAPRHPSFRCEDSERFYYVNEELHKPFYPPQVTSPRPTMRPTLKPEPIREFNSPSTPANDAFLDISKPTESIVPLQPLPVKIPEYPINNGFLLPPFDFKLTSFSYNLQPTVPFTSLISNKLIDPAKFDKTPVETARTPSNTFILAASAPGFLPEPLKAVLISKVINNQPEPSNFKTNSNRKEPLPLANIGGAETDSKQTLPIIKNIGDLNKLDKPMQLSTSLIGQQLDLGMFQALIEKLNAENAEAYKKALEADKLKSEKKDDVDYSAFEYPPYIRPLGITENVPKNVIATGKETEKIQETKGSLPNAAKTGIPDSLITDSNPMQKNYITPYNQQSTDDFNPNLSLQLTDLVKTLEPSSLQSFASRFNGVLLETPKELEYHNVLFKKETQKEKITEPKKTQGLESEVSPFPLHSVPSIKTDDEEPKLSTNSFSHFEPFHFLGGPLNLNVALLPPSKV